MGLEAINYSYLSDIDRTVRELLTSYGAIFEHDNEKYATVTSQNYFIEIELESDKVFNLRIALCNPVEEILAGLDKLFHFLLNDNKGKLKDLNSKGTFTEYDSKSREKLKSSYLQKRSIFQELYGDFTAPISSREFYERFKT